MTWRLTLAISALFFLARVCGAPLELISPNEELSGDFGVSVSGVSDVNGDGRGDVVIGARVEDPGASPFSAGRAYLFDGSTGALLQTLASPNEERNGFFGILVSGVSDINGVGRGDLVIGALRDDPGASPDDAGRAYIFLSGQPSIDVSPPFLSFGFQHIDLGPTGSMTVTITNNGAVALAFTGFGIEITGENASEFANCGGGLYTLDKFGGVFALGAARKDETEVTAPFTGSPYFYPFLYAEDLEIFAGDETEFER